jgi:hypothetical protein
MCIRVLMRALIITAGVNDNSEKKGWGDYFLTNSGNWSILNPSAPF